MKMNEKEIKELREFTREMIDGKRNSKMSFEEWSDCNFKEFVKVFEEFVKGLFEALGCELCGYFNYSDLYFSIPAWYTMDAPFKWKEEEDNIRECFFEIYDTLNDEEYIKESENLDRELIANSVVFKNKIDKLLNKGMEYCNYYPLGTNHFNDAQREVEYIADRIHDLIGEFLENKERRNSYIDVMNYAFNIVSQIEEEINTLGLGVLEGFIWNEDSWADDMAYLKELGL